MVHEMEGPANPDAVDKLMLDAVKAAGVDPDDVQDDEPCAVDMDVDPNTPLCDDFLKDMGVPTEEDEAAEAKAKAKAAIKAALEGFDRKDPDAEVKKIIALIAEAYPEPDTEADTYIEELVRLRGPGTKKRTLNSNLTTERKLRQQEQKRQSKIEDAARTAANATVREALMFDALMSLNETNAVVLIENTVKVMVQDIGGGMPSFISSEGFTLLEASNKAVIPVTKPDGTTSAELVPVAPTWLKWKARRMHRKITFRPYGINEHEGDTSPLIYNLWRGWQTVPRSGEWSRLRRHLFEVICHSNPYWFAWVMCWLADIVQDPGLKKGTAIVIKGPPGAGKSIVVDCVRRMMPNNSNSIAKGSQVTGRFNKHQAANLLTVMEEAFWAGDKQTEGVIKDMITSPHQMIEAKGIDAIQLPNFTRYWICSNEDWVVQADEKDRRFMVLGIKDDHVEDFKYFGAIVDQIKTGGLEAMMDDLARIKIPDWIQLRKPPRTPWLGEQIAESLPVTHQWFREVLDEEQMTRPADDRKNGDVITPLVEKGVVVLDKTEAYRSFSAFADARRTRYVPTPAKFAAFMADMGGKIVRPRAGEEVFGRRRRYDFGCKLEELQARFTARFGSHLVQEQDEKLDQKPGPVQLESRAAAEIDHSTDVPSTIDASELNAWTAFGKGGARPR